MHAAYVNLKSVNPSDPIGPSYSILKDGLNIRYNISITNLIREYEKYDWDMLMQEYLMLTLETPDNWDLFDALMTKITAHPYGKNIDTTIIFNKFKNT